jgi:phospholipid/cholesterol/gamma-HCH transport system substrate-binding protein
MERNANYALVGFASLMLVVGLVMFVFWLARVQFAQEYDIYDIVFQGPIAGLSTGGEVHFNGIKVGEVTKVALDQDDPKKVVAVAQVTAGTPVRADSYATLEPFGITGVNYVQITAGSANRPLLKDTVPKGQIPVIQSRSSALSSLLEGGGTLMNSAVETLSRVNRVLSDDNIKSFSGTMQDVQQVADEARKRKQLFADADQAVKSIDATAASIKTLSNNSNQLLTADGPKTMENISDAAAQIKEAADSAKSMLDKLNGPTSDFANNGLPQLTATVVSLQRTSETLNRLATEIEQNPRGLVSKPNAKDVEVKP